MPEGIKARGFGSMDPAKQRPVSTPLVIAFDEAAHEYRVGGEVWPSVTQCMERVGLVDFSYLPDHVRQAALARGSRVHRSAHFLCENDLEWSSVDDREKGYVEACASFLAASGFEKAGNERRVANPRLRYAGTVDAFGWWQGEIAIVDWTCGDLWETCKHVQTAGYSEAIRVVPPVELFDLTPTTPIARLGVRLQKTGRYSVELYRDPQDFAIFSCAVALAHYQIKAGMKGRKAA